MKYEGGVNETFIRASQTFLKEFLSKIEEAVGKLSDEQIWHRSNDASNSIGNLLLHLEGNVRQHIISGVGQVPDTRNRPSEFAEKEGRSKENLLAALSRCVDEACAALDIIAREALLTTRVIQDKEVRLLDDIYHVVEHFSYHTGQIIWAAKAVTGKGFDWYKYLDKP